MLDDSVKFLYEIVKIYIKRLKSNPRFVLLRIDNLGIVSLCLTFQCEKRSNLKIEEILN